MFGEYQLPDTGRQRNKKNASMATTCMSCHCFFATHVWQLVLTKHNVLVPVTDISNLPGFIVSGEDQAIAIVRAFNNDIGSHHLYDIKKQEPKAYVVKRGHKYGLK